MCNNTVVYHTKFGRGIIVSENEKYYEIDFNGDIKTITSEGWLQFLFLSVEDMYSKDKTRISHKYDKYIRKNSEKDTKEYQDDEQAQLTVNNDVELISQEIQDNSIRNIVIILNRQIKKNNLNT